MRKQCPSPRQPDPPRRDPPSGATAVAQRAVAAVRRPIRWGPSALSALVVALLPLTPLSVMAAAPTPKGGCPQPNHTLVINEVQVGIGAKPRWLEFANPGTSAVSLANVVVRIQAKGLGGAPADAFGVLEFPFGDAILELPPGEVILVGHLPSDKEAKAGPGPWFGLKLLEAGPAFVLPLCDVKVQLLGPAGPIDSFVYSLCKDGVAPVGDAAWQTIIALDPAHQNICANDAMAVWCQPNLPSSGAKPTPGKSNEPCDLDGDGYTAATGDCADKDHSISPIAIELCNGKDDDCDGATDEGVAAPIGTCLGYGVCAGPLPDGSPIAVCDGKNGFVCNYPVGYESLHETLCDGFDNDCDGQTDEGLQNACGTCGTAPAELCNGSDDDCDGQTDEVPDLTMVSCGGKGVCVGSKAVCAGPAPVCSLPPSFEVTETRCDGLDNDCDGQTDEELGLGQACDVGAGLCAAVGIVACAPSGLTACVAATGSPVAEVCGNNQDDDCDGATDEGFGVGSQCLVGLGACQVVGKRICAPGPEGGVSTESMCLATATVPAAAERCENQRDDDCDGFTDEPGCVGAAVEEGCSAIPTRPAAVDAQRAKGALLLAAIVWAWLRRRRSSVAESRAT